ncbi:MAG: ankyrin repeat domain-containing protein [Planctomycetes bacterium]|nr:ankyrin repeat domain-containing protein [Planctomycetota bacterium]
MTLLIASLIALAAQDKDPEIFRQLRAGAGADQIAALLEKDPARVRARAELEETPLHDAARFSSLDVVKLLVDKGADVRSVCYNRFTPLYFACSAGKADVAKVLIAKGADLEASSTGGTPMQAAALHGHKDVVKALIEAGALYDFDSAIYLSDEARINALLADEPALALGGQSLHQACRGGNARIVALMLAQGAGPNQPGEYWHEPPLFHALQHPAVVKLLLDKGADPKARVDMKGVRSGATLLHLAAGGPADTARLLIAAGADLNAILVDRNGEKRVFTPLHVAAQAGSPEMTELFLGCKVDPLLKTWTSQSALQLATAHIRPVYKPEQAAENRRRADTARILIAAGLEIDLHSAIALDDGARVAALVKERPVWFDELDAQEYTPLQKAVTLSRGAMARAFLAAGADVNGRGRDGGRALHDAAFWGLPDMVRLLLDAKADVNAPNGHGDTPLSEALRVRPHTEDVKAMDAVIKLLRDAGGK